MRVNFQSSSLLDHIYEDTQTTSKSTGISRSVLKRLRLSGVLQEGVHWVRVGSRAIKFNKFLLIDWLVNERDPAAHQRAIDNFLASLPSNQKKIQSTARQNWGES
jgi:hypothetical protein